MREDYLIDEAIDALNRATGLEPRVLRREYDHLKDTGIDAVIYLPDHGMHLNVQVKAGTTQMNVGAIAAKFQQQGRLDDMVLIGEYINPALAKRLIDARIQFIDTAGNAYLNRKPLYIQITGNKHHREAIGHTQKTGRAFQQTGMKVIFAILKDQNLLNANYRLIAERADVALGNIGWILNDLTYQGFIQEGFKKNTRTIANYDKLLDKWVEEYPTKLKAKLRLGKFTTENPHWWNEVDPRNFGAFWGGELAAAKYTGYLNPKDCTVYMNKNGFADFITQARLKKFNPARPHEIQVDIFKQFWVEKPDYYAEPLTHPILTYADLVETADPRNLETAERLREKLIH